MLSFLFGLGAGAIAVLNPDGTRRLLATILVKGQEMLLSVSSESARLSQQMSEEVSDIVAEARAQHNESK
jgi:hypothetical protein